MPAGQRMSAVQSDWSAIRQKMKRQPYFTPGVNAWLITVTKPITPPARIGARGLQKELDLFLRLEKQIILLLRTLVLR